jgi:hypothetical protein
VVLELLEGSSEMVGLDFGEAEVIVAAMDEVDVEVLLCVVGVGVAVGVGVGVGVAVELEACAPEPAPELPTWKTTMLAVSPGGTVTTQKLAPPAPAA